MGTEKEIIRLYFGCGNIDYHSKGYKNVDIRKFPHVDFVCDVGKRLPWESDTVHEILAESILEHLPHSFMQGTADGTYLNIIAVLNEWRRVLKPGGVCIIRVPNIQGTIKEFYKGKMPHSGFWMLLYGGQSCKEDTHLCGFDPFTLKKVMQLAGFRNIRLCCSHAYDDPLAEDVAWEMTAIGVK